MRRFLAFALIALLTACGTSPKKSPVRTGGNFKLGNPYQIDGQWYYPDYDPSYDRRGVASWYGAAFHGKPTANGEIFDRHSISAAHTTLPLPSLVEVTNLDNDRKMIIRVNDRGPFVGNRIIDLSEAAAKELGFHRQGLANVRVRFVDIASDARGVPPRPIAAHKPEPRGRAAPQMVAAVQLPAPRTVCPANEHFVQVAALSDARRADAIEGEIARLGPVWRETLEPSTGRLHRIRIGPLADRRRAFDVLSHLRRLGYQEAYVGGCQGLAS